MRKIPGHCGPHEQLPEARPLAHARPSRLACHTIIRDPAKLGELKGRPGKDIALLGSSALTASIVRLGLLDELRIMVNPVALGAGRPVLRGGALTRYRLLRTRVFDSGNVLPCYQPRSAQA
jgi:dihydrofolate reductase